MKRMLAAILCVTVLLMVSPARAASYTIPDEFSFSYPEGWDFSDTAFREKNIDNSFWLCIAFDSETCLLAEKTEMRTLYSYMDLKDASLEEMESIKSDFMLWNRGGTYLETVHSDADGTPFLVYSYTNIGLTKDGEHKSVFYQGITLLGGWVISFLVYGNQQADVRRDVNENDLRILRNALSSFRSLVVPMPRTESFYYSVNNGKAAIRGYFGTDTDLDIPSEISDYPVTEIGDHAFAGCSGLTRVSIPAGVTDIGDYAFSTCSSLVSITVPYGVTKIPGYAFYVCSSLKEVELPKTVSDIGAAAFSGCSGLVNITIPEYVTNIGDEAFESCRALKYIAIPANVESIGTDVFELCGKLIEISVDPANMKYSSADGILYNKSGKTLLNCPDGKTGKITIPSGVTAINAEAFTFCSISEVVLQYGVKRIGHWAFDICSSLTAIEIPMSVTFIDNDVFGGCGNLTIYSYKGQYAQKYAKAHNIPFSEIPKVAALTIWNNEAPAGREALMIDLASGTTGLALSAVIEPSDAHGEVLWSSSASSIASVDATGLVIGHKPGTTTIAATAADGSKVKASVKVNVTFLAKGVTITGKDTITAGKQITLKATVLPETTVNKKVTWASSDTAIATVSAAGVVTTKKVTETKTVTITTITKDGSGVFAEFVITVIP